MISGGALESYIIGIYFGIGGTVMYCHFWTVAIVTVTRFAPPYCLKYSMLFHVYTYYHVHSYLDHSIRKTLIQTKNTDFKCLKLLSTTEIPFVTDWIQDLENW